MNAVSSTLPLAGSWCFAVDPNDVGIMEKWFGRLLPDERVDLPGSMAEYDKGNDIALDTPWTGRIHGTIFFTDDRYAKYRQPGSIKLPFWLTPLKHYMGAAWYQREVVIPEGWADKQGLVF